MSGEGEGTGRVAESGTAAASQPREWFTLRWDGDAVLLLDQRRLPAEESYLRLRKVEEVAEAIETLAVRGAPAIGCAAAMGIALAAAEIRTTDVASLPGALEPSFERLARTRPTAVNLFWALDRMREVVQRESRAPDASPAALFEALVREAQRILDEDVESCHAIGRAGCELVPEGARILTHCNAGALATGGYGTALGVVRAATEQGRKISVLADETRPALQGARLTAWELARDAIPVTVLTDNMAGHLMHQGEVDLVLVGADRVAANGDTANKIGTYPLAVLAREHGLPFYVAVPLSSIDLATPNGDAIPLEERGRAEVAEFGGQSVVPRGVPIRHPAFDVTPARYITAFVTEKGVVKPPYPRALRALFSGKR